MVGDTQSEPMPGAVVLGSGERGGKWGDAGLQETLHHNWFI